MRYPMTLAKDTAMVGKLINRQTPDFSAGCGVFIVQNALLL